VDAECAGDENCDYLHGLEITVPSPRHSAVIHICDIKLSNAGN
jgi:hypothetical protein